MCLYTKLRLPRMFDFFEMILLKWLLNKHFKVVYFVENSRSKL